MANKSTGGKVASTAGRVLGSSNATALQRSLAGSALAQTGTSKTTSKAMETKASSVLQSTKNATAKTLAGSLVSQSKRKP